VTDVRIQRVVHRKADAQALVIRETKFRKPLSDRAQADAFRSDVLLPFDIGGADNPPEALQGFVAKVEVLTGTRHQRRRIA